MASLRRAATGSDEFWDAWDIAADCRASMEIKPSGAIGCSVGVAGGQLVVRSVERQLRNLDLRLKADCPWLELMVSVDWRQRHELLRLERPLPCRRCVWRQTPVAGLSNDRRVRRHAANANDGRCCRVQLASRPRHPARASLFFWTVRRGSMGTRIGWVFRYSAARPGRIRRRTRVSSEVAWR